MPVTKTVEFVYIVVGVFTYRRVVGQLAWKFMEKSKLAYPLTNANLKFPNGANWTGAMLVGFILAVVWPMVLPLSYLVEKSEIGFGGIFYLPQKQKERMQAKRIRELERELDIKNAR